MTFQTKFHLIFHRKLKVGNNRIITCQNFRYRTSAFPCVPKFSRLTKVRFIEEQLTYRQFT